MNLEEHEEKLKEINERFIAGKVSRQTVEREIAVLLGETNLAYRLQERLIQQINQQISPKAKERLSIRQYLMKRDELENQVIQSGFPYGFFENESTLEEIEGLNPDVIDKKTLPLIIISALKMYIDNEQETEPKAEALHRIYLRLKSSLCAEIPFDSGDGFIDYLKNRNHRIDLEDARISGNICPFCEGHEVKSYDSEKWVCKSCGKFFRKHRAKKEEK
jgi:hypothetical protein